MLIFYRCGSESRDWEVTQWLGATAALAEDLGPVPRTTCGSSQLPVTLDPGDHVHALGTHRFRLFDLWCNWISVAV